MSRFLERVRFKKTRLNSSPPPSISSASTLVDTASTSVPAKSPPLPHTSERNPTYKVTLDTSIYFFETVREISEATELLAPLKAVCGMIVKALETTRVCIFEYNDETY